MTKAAGGRAHCPDLPLSRANPMPSPGKRFNAGFRDRPDGFPGLPVMDNRFRREMRGQRGAPVQPAALFLPFVRGISGSNGSPSVRQSGTVRFWIQGFGSYCRQGPSRKKFPEGPDRLRPDCWDRRQMRSRPSVQPLVLEFLWLKCSNFHPTGDVRKS